MISVSWAGGLCRVTLDRPDKANALTEAMLAAVAEAAEEAADRAHVFVITGAGGVFSAGADLAEAKAGLATSPVWERASGAIAGLPCLTIAALNGTCAGGAMGAALACDLRVAVPGATFFYPVMKLGFLPQPSDPSRMAALVGPARAKAILMGGRRIDAAEALAWGLIDAVVDAAGLDAAVDDLSAAALGAERAHIAAIKALVP